MYSSFPNHLFQFTHLIISFYLIFMFYPKLVLKSSYETKLENIISNYILMVFGIILLGYLLVVLKIYEFLGIFIMLLLGFIYVYRHSNFENKREENRWKYMEMLFDYVDGLKNIKTDFKRIVKNRFFKIKTMVCSDFKDGAKIWNVTLLLVTLGYSSYLRLYDVYFNAAPSMSDSYTTLSWMKSISNRILFPDGIYPQGLHIYLATLQKVAFIDSLYVLRYVGPINCVFIALGTYFVVSRITKDKNAGVVGAIIYGILISFFYNDLYSDWQRQGATNSQEFAYLFVIPTLYFFAKYITTYEKRDMITAFAGVAITALVHTIAFVFVAIGVVCLIVMAAMINFKKHWNGIKRIIAIGVISSLIGIIPVGIGVLSGKWFHLASEIFLTEKVSVMSFQPLTIMDCVGLTSLLLAFVYILFNFKKTEENLLFMFFIVLNIVSFLIYYLGGYITQNTVVANRFTDFWVLTEPVIIGMGFYSIVNILINNKIRNIATAVLCTFFILFSIFYIRPKPIAPYKMEYNVNVEQYLRISKELLPTTWTIVSQQEGYAVVMGKGYHLLMGYFLKTFNPETEKLISSSGDVVLETPDVFLFQEKVVFTTNISGSTIDYQLRRVENQQLQIWVNKYKETHTNLSTFYEDDDIIIYRIKQEGSNVEIQNKIWGN